MVKDKEIKLVDLVRMKQCRICELSPELRNEIEEDMRMKIGPTIISQKYSEFGITEDHVRNHKKHLVLWEAQDQYEEIRSGKSENYFGSTSTPTPRFSLPTGNHILDDLLVLDRFIEQSGSILDQVTPSHVMQAIDLKHKILEKRGPTEETEHEDVIKMNVLLKLVCEEEEKK